MRSSRCRGLAGLLVVVLLGAGRAAGSADEVLPPPKEIKKDKPQMVAGRSELLRHIPKKFATLQAVDPARRQVTLLAEGDKEAKTWAVNLDGEVKIHGWWGRLDQLRTGDRVWVWFDIDRNKQPKSVLMLADELSQQDIHGAPHTLQAVDAQTQEVTLKPARGNARRLKLADELRIETAGATVRLITVQKNGGVRLTEALKLGGPVFVQSAGETARLLVDAAGLEALRAEQRASLRRRWVDEGLPGTVIFLHQLGGEMELMLDHEAIRWGRNLTTGDRVTIQTDTPIAALVKEVRPWRERTQLRLVVGAFDQSDLAVGQRVLLTVPPPPPEVDEALLPPDLDRPRGKKERIEWFLASIYCTCKVRGETCTGMFYTLASCNVNACGMPTAMADRIAELIDAGKTDREMFEILLKEHGPLLLKPHLLP